MRAEWIAHQRAQRLDEVGEIRLAEPAQREAREA